METGDYFVIAMFLTFVGFLFTGFPVAWVLGGVAVLFTLIATISDTWFGTMTGLDYLTLGMSVNRIFKYMDNWVLVALPMFIFMGLMLDKSGIAEKMMESMQELFGKINGGLAVTVTVIGIVLAASTGIIGASVVLLGLLSLPAMINQGYSKTLALGTIASAGTLGILIPPSIMLVIMADQLGLSVGDLFMGAVIPGLLLGVLYILYILIFSFIKPSAAPISKDRRPIEWRMIVDVFKTILPPVILIIAVLGSIFAGITTPTEASGVGALGATILAWYNKRLKFSVVVDVMKGCFNTTAYIFAIFLGATTF
ncbi:MAG: TRAP transporter large permease subunit, partial [Proteobacteria bacterium]|nr:TRAP transporter large permease subunit [Pseudomonadota bacterium]